MKYCVHLFNKEESLIIVHEHTVSLLEIKHRHLSQLIVDFPSSEPGFGSTVTLSGIVLNYRSLGIL